MQTIYKEVKTKKGEGYMSSMRPRWRNKLRTYLEANLSDDELAYVQDTAKTRHYKKEKDDVGGKASLKNLQATD